MRIIQLCVVGAGAWSTAMHLPILKKLRQLDHVRFPAVCDLDESRASRYARELGAGSVCSDMAAMLQTVPCDGVVLLVPPGANPTVIRIAAHHKKPFLVEKPPAPSARVHQALIRAVGRLPHVVAYNRRHSPYAVQAAEWLRGTHVQSVTAQFSRHRRREPDFTATAVHAIDMVRFLGGDDVVEYQVDSARTRHVCNFFIRGWFDTGARCEIHITPDTGSAEEHYVVRATERTVAMAFPHRGVHDLPGFVERREGNRVVQHLGPRDFGMAPSDTPSLAGILGEHRSFVRLLRRGGTSSATLADTLQTQQIRDSLESRLSGKSSGHR